VVRGTEDYTVDLSSEDGMLDYSLESAKLGSQYLISRLTIVEMESVFALKARAGEIDQLC